MTHDEKGIRDLVAKYEELLNASDAESIAGLYAADGVFMPEGFPTAAGREAVLQSYGAIFENITLTIEFEVDEIMVGEGLGTAVTRSNGSVRVNATGDEAPEFNREVFVFAQEDGPWRIARAQNAWSIIDEKRTISSSSRSDSRPDKPRVQTSPAPGVKAS